MILSLYKKFQTWSKKGSVYLISDTHFDDIDCHLMDSNWISPQEHINRINKVVGKNDTLIHLGDIGNPVYLDQVKGYKVLIKGNHDLGNSNYEQYFDEIYEGPLFIGEKILLSHEPLFDLFFCINIHSHIHRKDEYIDELHKNLAANVVNFEVFNLQKYLKSGVLKKTTSLHRLTIEEAKTSK